MELILNLMSTLLVSFWLIIWIMHLCALYNARLKFNNGNYTISIRSKLHPDIDITKHGTESDSTSTKTTTGKHQARTECVAHIVPKHDNKTNGTKQKRKSFTYKQKLIFFMEKLISKLINKTDSKSLFAGKLFNDIHDNNYNHGLYQPMRTTSDKYSTTNILKSMTDVRTHFTNEQEECQQCHSDDNNLKHILFNDYVESVQDQRNNNLTYAQDNHQPSLAVDQQTTTSKQLVLTLENKPSFNYMHDNIRISQLQNNNGKLSKYVSSEGRCPFEQVCCLADQVGDGNNNNNLFSYNQSAIKTFDNTAINCLPLPGVSIVKPLLGVDSNLRSNLETFFHMDYPLYELLFCVQDEEDEAIPLVEELFKSYPEHDVKLFIGNGTRVGVNPKINNMQPAYEACKYQLILISDSGISMKQDTLLDMVCHMRDDVALVHQMPFVLSGRTSFQSIVERVYFGTSHARAYLTADLLNINCPTGMSALMRKCLLDEVGGIKAFGQYLAEDFFFAKSFTDRGWKISICSQPALQNSANSSDTISTLNSRIQRWIKLRFAMVPFWTLLEPFSECILLGLLCSMSFSYLWTFNPFSIFIPHTIIWFLLDYKLLCSVQGGPLPCSKIEFTLAWLLRESTAFVIYLKALASSEVTWRTRTFKLKWGGFAEEVGYDTQTYMFRKCSVDSSLVHDTLLEKSVRTIDDVEDTRTEKVMNQQVAEPNCNELSTGIYPTSLLTMTTRTSLNAASIITSATSDRSFSTGTIQDYENNIKVDCNHLRSDQHQLMDMAILAQA